ncbi:unnamed protein product [Arctogadus glacialis]
MQDSALLSVSLCWWAHSLCGSRVLRWLTCSTNQPLSPRGRGGTSTTFRKPALIIALLQRESESPADELDCEISILESLALSLESGLA